MNPGNAASDISFATTCSMKNDDVRRAVGPELQRDRAPMRSMPGAWRISLIMAANVRAAVRNKFEQRRAHEARLECTPGMRGRPRISVVSFWGAA